MCGDIITYFQDGYLVTHRIISKDEDTYITKGDFNNAPDTKIFKEQIEGKVIYHFPKGSNLQFSARIEH